MKWLTLALIGFGLSASALAQAEECDGQVKAIRELTAKFVNLKYQIAADRDTGNAMAANDMDELSSKFNRLPKTSKCRAPVFHALVGLFASSSPFDQDGLGGQSVDRVLAESPKLKSDYALAKDEFNREHQGQYALTCRAADLEQRVDAHVCQRKHPNREDCFAHQKSYAKCADLPETD